ncbi:TPA: transporter substrate-binding domain-containing protein [Streptococcus equi subsp. zooepidemicus]|nr:transporter substrate-binding domain-containing protein [Streptococcus equi subsp. zooepidemicus]
MTKQLQRALFLLLASLGLLAVMTNHEVTARQKEVVRVATDAATKPFTYRKKHSVTGYDIEVLKRVFKGSKKYRLSIEVVPFPSILAGIDAGRYQIGANNFGYSKERAEKYLFSSPISASHYALATKGKQQYKSLAELSGKKTQGIAGSNYMLILEKWNQSHPDQKPIHLTYASESTPLTQRLQLLENGQLDFLFYDAISLTTVAEEQGFDLHVTKLKEQADTAKDGLEYYVFANDQKGKALQSFVNKRLAKLKKSGQLRKLSQAFLGGDFVTKVN